MHRKTSTRNKWISFLFHEWSTIFRVLTSKEKLRVMNHGSMFINLFLLSCIGNQRRMNDCAGSERENIDKVVERNWGFFRISDEKKSWDKNSAHRSWRWCEKLFIRSYRVAVNVESTGRCNGGWRFISCLKSTYLHVLDGAKPTVRHLFLKIFRVYLYFLHLFTPRAGEPKVLCLIARRFDGFAKKKKENERNVNYVHPK